MEAFNHGQAAEIVDAPAALIKLVDQAFTSRLRPLVPVLSEPAGAYAGGLI